MPVHRQRWMAMCVRDDGTIDWLGYQSMTSKVTLPEFLDLEELATVAKDRRFAWDAYLQKHPDLLAGLPTG